MHLENKISKEEGEAVRKDLLAVGLVIQSLRRKRKGQRTMENLGNLSHRVPSVGIVARDVGEGRKSNGMSEPLFVEIVREQRYPFRLDSLDGTASELGTVLLTQLSGKVRSLYAKWWGQLAPGAFYYPCSIPLPLSKLENVGITFKDERGEGATPIYDWVELPPRQRTVSRLCVRDDVLSKPRVGNAWNLREDWESLYWDGQQPSNVVKSMMAPVTTRIGITIPGKCVDEYRDMCHGFLRGKARKNQVLFIAEAVKCLHHWRVPITFATVSAMAKYANGLDHVPSEETIRSRMEPLGLIHSDTLSTGARVYSFQ